MPMTAMFTGEPLAVYANDYDVHWWISGCGHRDRALQMIAIHLWNSLFWETGCFTTELRRMHAVV